MTKIDTASKNLEVVATQMIPAEEMNPKSVDDVVKLPAFYEKMQALEKLFNKPYSELDHEIQQTLELRRLQQLINTMKLNPLWKERIAQSGLTEVPRNFEEWQQIPITDKSLVSDYFTGPRLGLVVPLNYGGFEIVASGGTSSGTPSETVYALRELWDTYKIAGKFMGDYVLRDYLAGNDPKWM
ncbi:MAG: hypothetical protein ACU84J_15955, partial [Gammaproteobacteria bacterium]